MKTVFYILILLLTSTLNAQQNLVPNGSFEEYDDCPHVIMQTYYEPGADNIYSVKNWFASTLGTADYFNICDTSINISGIPTNYVGYQKPQNGNAYCGLIAIKAIANFSDYHEYIETQLSEPLIDGEIYHWSFYVSLANSSEIAVNKIGLALSDTLYVDYNTNGLSSLEAITIADIGHSDNIVTDTINWTKISGKYVAHGGEEFLLIGLFYDSLNVDKITYGPSNYATPGAYYYIDNVQLCKGECNNDFDIPNVFTPNNDGVNDVFTLVNNQSVKLSNISIFNRWGNQVFYSETQINWDGTFNQKNCSDGVYFYVINYYQNNQLKSKQGTIHLIR